MGKLIYIEASPLKSRSHTIAVARSFLDAYAAAHPQDQIERVDLWATDLPPFDEETIQAKFAVLRKMEFTPEQMGRWEAVRAISRQFNSADRYVFAVPMWNFGIPYPLKHYIDVITLPGENWSWSKANGYEALLSGKKALMIYSSASQHLESGEHASDFQKPYLRRWLRFIGVNELHEIAVSPTLGDADEVAATRAAAIREAVRLAPAF